MESYAQILLRSRCIFTATSAAPFAGYVAIADGKLLAAKQGEPPAALIGPDTTVYELGARTVCPGFFDAHTFFTGWAMQQIGVDASAAKTAQELVALARRHADTLSANAPVWGHGWNSSLFLPENEQLLEEAFGGRPVVLFAQGCERVWMNRAATARYGFDASADCNEAFWKLLEEMLQDHDFIAPLFSRYMQLLNSRGITSVKEIGYDTFSTFPNVLEALAQSNDMSVRVHFMSQPVKEGASLAFGRAMRDRFQGDFVQFSGYNRMTDGSISQLCGLLKQPYTCAPATVCKQTIDWDTITSEVLEADAQGFRFSLNAQGDGAVARAVDIFAQCARDADGKLVNRHAITEAEFSDPLDIERMAQLGILCEFYPQIQSIADREGKTTMIAEKLGDARGQFYWNRRKLVDSGVSVCCGTDLPLVIDDIPQSLYHTVTGKFPEGGAPFLAQNTLSVAEVLTAWTRGGAYDMYREAQLGTLEAGKKADIVVLSADVFATPIDEVREVSVCLTLVDGRVVYTMPTEQQACPINTTTPLRSIYSV